MAHGLAELIAGWNGKKNGHVFRWNWARRILEQFFEGGEGARRECIHAFKCTRKQSARKQELKYISFFNPRIGIAFIKNQEWMGLKKQKSMVK